MTKDKGVWVTAAALIIAAFIGGIFLVYNNQDKNSTVIEGTEIRTEQYGTTIIQTGNGKIEK